jgi:hypothetical protein
MNNKKGQTEFIKNILYNTIEKGKGLRSGTIITGVGINHEDHLGLQLLILNKLPKGEYVDCEFRILRTGNAKKDLEKYAKKDQIVNLQMLSKFKDKYFRQDYFTIESNLKKCPLRFKIGEQAIITGYINSGLKVKIVSIEKYPDDPKSNKEYFGAYYNYEITGQKLDENLQKIK